MSNYHPVIIQADNSYPSTAATSSSASYLMPSSPSSSKTSSSSSRQSYLHTTTTSTSQSAPFVSSPSTRPAQAVGECPYGQQEFVYTGRPQGGNPNGGPRQHPEGYNRISKGHVTVHNTGGLYKGQVPVRLARKYANGPEHTAECIDLSGWSDNQGLCFCPSRSK